MPITLWPSRTLGINWRAQRAPSIVSRYVERQFGNFHRVTTQPYGYLVLDLHPASSDNQRLLSHILKDEGWTRYYQKRPNGPKQ